MIKTFNVIITLCKRYKERESFGERFINKKSCVRVLYFFLYHHRKPKLETTAFLIVNIYTCIKSPIQGYNILRTK